MKSTTNTDFKRVLLQIRRAHKEASLTKSKLDKINAQVSALNIQANQIKRQYTTKKNILKKLATQYSEQSSQVIIVESNDYFMWGLDREEINSIGRILCQSDGNPTD